MALSFQLNGHLLEVCEQIHSFHNTRTTYWYYDLRNKMVSSHGRKGDVPDRIMTLSDTARVREHYLPKVGLKDYP